MVYELDARRFTEKEAAHAYLKEALHLPDYYGNNLDALADCLSEREEVTIYLQYEEEGGPYMQKLLKVFHALGVKVVTEGKIV